MQEEIFISEKKRTTFSFKVMNRQGEGMICVEMENTRTRIISDMGIKKYKPHSLDLISLFIIREIVYLDQLNYNDRKLLDKTLSSIIEMAKYMYLGGEVRGVSIGLAIGNRIENLFGTLGIDFDRISINGVVEKFLVLDGRAYAFATVHISADNKVKGKVINYSGGGFFLTHLSSAVTVKQNFAYTVSLSNSTLIKQRTKRVCKICGNEPTLEALDFPLIQIA